jgi:hypothetical protein
MQFKRFALFVGFLLAAAGSAQAQLKDRVLIPAPIPDYGAVAVPAGVPVPDGFAYYLRADLGWGFASRNPTNRAKRLNCMTSPTLREAPAGLIDIVASGPSGGSDTRATGAASAAITTRDAPYARQPTQKPPRAAIARADFRCPTGANETCPPGSELGAQSARPARRNRGGLTTLARNLQAGRIADKAEQRINLQPDVAQSARRNRHVRPVGRPS